MVALIAASLVSPYTNFVIVYQSYHITTRTRVDQDSEPRFHGRRTWTWSFRVADVATIEVTTVVFLLS